MTMFRSIRVLLITAAATTQSYSFVVSPFKSNNVISSRVSTICSVGREISRPAVRQKERCVNRSRLNVACHDSGSEKDNIDKGEENPQTDCEFGSVSPNQTRRTMLIASSSFALSAVLGIPHAVRASDGEDKIILSTSTSNLPLKYADTSTAAPSPLETLAPPKPSSGMCIDPETKRIEVFERSAPSVVYIDTFTEQRDAFSPNVLEVPLGAGSGFVWDDKGHIVTNFHVIRNAQSAQVAILQKVIPNQEVSTDVFGRATGISPYTSMRPGGDPSVTNFKRSVYKAKVVGVDPGKDIAVLKVDAPVYDLYPIAVGTSKNLKVGQETLAIGNPFGLDHTLTVGVVSGTGREVRSPIGRPISNVIQTDAAVNPGNSGGPLLDSSGRLIGMTTAIYSTSGASAGIGFAIPADTVKYIVDTLIRDGQIVRPILGISFLESKQAKALGITKGVLVLDVPTGSPAYRAGMRPTRRTESGLIEIGDIIVQVEDKKINTESDLFEALESYKPGDRVKVTVNRIDRAAADLGDLKMKDVILTIELKASTDVGKSIKFDGGGGYHPQN